MPYSPQLDDTQRSELRERLSPEAYAVLVEAGTEKMASGEYFRHFEVGTYHCKACHAPVFASEHKYASYSGWPSFHSPFSETAITEVWDDHKGHFQLAATCAQCGCHLGHKLRDERTSTNWRYCINSVALHFKPPAEGGA